MRHEKLVSLVALTALIVGSAGLVGQDKDRPALTVPVTEARPAIDGKLNDACWKDAAEIRLSYGATKGATTARICRDGDTLYVAITCKTSVAIPKGEHVALLISPNNDSNSHYLVRIGADKTRDLSYREYSPPWLDVSWAPKLDVGIQTGDDAWVAEIALPLQHFNRTRKLTAEIGFNLCRQDMANNETHCWRGDFANPAAAGLLRGIPPRDFAAAAEEPKPIALGPGSAHPGSSKVRLELEGFLMGGDPHARGVVWDVAVNEKTGELYVLSVPRVRNCPEVQVFDRQGKYLRTVMPFNPTLPKDQVRDLARRTAVEGGVPLVLPKYFEIFGAVETSLYGEWWHFPQKLVIAPNGDLILANIYRGTLWRLKPDGSLPKEGWTSLYSPERNEPFESTLDIDVKLHGGLNAIGNWYVHKLENYLPFPELCYPYMAVAPDGTLHISRGMDYKSTSTLKHFATRWEVPYGGAPRQQLDSTAAWWSMKLRDGVKVENVKGYQFDGKEEALKRPKTLPIKKEEAGTPVIAECGLALQGNHLLLSDRKDNRLLVFDAERRQVAAISQYKAGGKDEPLAKPTAMAVDNQGCIYLLVEGKDKRVIKLKSWKEPELLATSAPVHAETIQLTLDRQANPPLVWVANGGGPGTLLQLAGDDLSQKGKWGDTGEALSSPGQQGYVPILNIDPETGHVYVEDDADYRFGKRGETYRLDQDGKILKRWPAVTKDVPRLETLFGKDGKLYWWEQGKIWRYERDGKPLPFKATGKDHLVVHPKVHHVGIYMGMDVDRQGNIYCVNTKSGLDVYDADGNLKKADLIHLNSAVRGIQLDADGNIYAISRVAPQLLKDRVLGVYEAPLLHLAKYPPEGGKPLWSIPWTGVTGRDQVLVAGCGCLRPRLHQALDGKGYLYAAGLYSIQVLDTKTGQLVGEFGSYGNMDCQGKGSKYPHPELPFGTISAVAVHKDRLFAVDLLNRRIVKCRIIYE